MMTGFEQAYSLPNESLNSYLTRSHTQRDFEVLGTTMAAHDHPVIQYAGAWALADAAIYRRRGRGAKRPLLPEEPPEATQRRMILLDRAAVLWDDLQEPLEAEVRVSARRHNTEVAADYLGLVLQARQAVASVANFRLAARLFSGTEVSSDDIQTSLAETECRLALFGKHTLESYPPNISYINRVRAGIYAEASCLLLIQSVGRVAVPATFRQDHHYDWGRRADLLSVSAARPFPRRLIQVTSSTNGEDTSKRMVVHTRDDLIISPGMSINSTLEALISRATGSEPPTPVSDRLQEMSRALVGRLTVQPQNAD